MRLFKTREQLLEEKLRRIDDLNRGFGGTDLRPVEAVVKQPEPAHDDPFAAAAASGAALELLRDMKGKMETMATNVAELERKFDERVPAKVLSEEAFRQEVVDSGNLAQEIIEGVKDEIQAAANARPMVAARDLTVIEQKRIEKILSVLQEHEKLSSPQLASIMNLSRTRCNEYFRQMDYALNLVGPDHVAIGTDILVDHTDGVWWRAVTGRLYPEVSQGMTYETHNIAGFMRQTDFPAVAQAMLDHGYDKETVRKIIGANWQRVFRQVWDA